MSHSDGIVLPVEMVLSNANTWPRYDEDRPDPAHAGGDHLSFFVLLSKKTVVNYPGLKAGSSEAKS